MTAGALIFAIDTEHTDYVAMAAWSAQRVKHWLQIPVAVATNNPKAGDHSVFDRILAIEPQGENSRWFGDLGQSVTWHNSNRVDAYKLTPWDQTLVIDADYVVNSSDLVSLLCMPQDFVCHRQAYDITRPGQEFLTTFGQRQFPMWWATVMMFRRSNTAQYIFDCMQMIKENWQHYRDLYHISEPTYRNDYALSIALGIVSGHTLNVAEIPWPLATVTTEAKITDHYENFWSIGYADSQGKAKTVSFFGQDFHAMCKKELGAVIEAQGRTRLPYTSAEH